MDTTRPEGAPPLVSLDDVAAADPALAGAKAANLARARAAGLPTVPGVVLTTAWSPADRGVLRAAWVAASRSGAFPVAVRSSSTGEDGGASSMAGVFESLLDVADEAAFSEAVRAVLGSGASAAAAGLADADMAVLVQPMVEASWGGVLFGADPVTGRRDRLVVAAVPGGPSTLVSGEVDGWTGVLNRRGKLLEVRSGAIEPPATLLRRLARLAAKAAATFGGPSDIEWAATDDGTELLLQARPITTLAPRSAPVLGPGPVAESFPDPLARLEQDLWLTPLRDGLREALRLMGTSPARALDGSPLVVSVEGRAAVDLELLGVEDPDQAAFLRRLDPRPPARRLRAAWRVGRLRHAVDSLGVDLVRRVDMDLAAVPALDQLGNIELLAVLRNARRSLASVHGHEALAGLLIPEAEAASVTGASLALSAVAQARDEGVSLCDLVERDPVVLALVPPRIGPTPAFAELVSAPIPAGRTFDSAGEDVEAHPSAVTREALRLRVRWLQELTGRAAWELGRRLVDVGVLPSQAAVRSLTFDELEHAVRRRAVPGDLTTRRDPAGRPLPSRFRLTDAGVPVAVAPGPRRRARRRGVPDDAGVGAGGGVGTGTVLVGGVAAGGDARGVSLPSGTVLVVPHLDPRLAPLVGNLAGLVAETGNPLSHLAILAREHGVPTVVGLPGAVERFQPGSTVVVDGQAGTVRTIDGLPTDRPALPQAGDGAGLLSLGARP